MIPRQKMSRALREHLQRLEDAFRKRQQRRSPAWTARDRRALRKARKHCTDTCKSTCATCTSGFTEIEKHGSFQYLPKSVTKQANRLVLLVPQDVYCIVWQPRRGLSPAKRLTKTGTTT